MKLKTLTLLCVSFLYSLSSSVAQSNDNYHDQLYYLCKTWGHAKYFHAEIAAGNVDWDDALLDAVAGLQPDMSPEEFNTIIADMLATAGGTYNAGQPLPTIIDSLNNNADLSWISTEVFTEEIVNDLEEMQATFRLRSNTYLEDPPFPGGPPGFTTDSRYFDSSMDNLRVGLLGLFRYWNIIHYFFPYKNIMDQDWDATLREMIPVFVAAENELDYHLAMKLTVSKINDTHGFFSSPRYNRWVGSATLPILPRFTAGQVYVKAKLPRVTELEIGDVITAIDGESMADFRARYRPYISASNERMIDRDLNSFIFRGDVGTVNLTIDDGSGSTKNVQLQRDLSNKAALFANDNSSYFFDQTSDGCSVGIVDMGLLERNEVPAMFNAFRETDHIIFDIRNYPNGTLWEIVNYIYRSSIHIATFSRPRVDYPGVMVWDEAYIGQGNSNPYDGNIIILFNEQTQSQAEYTVMGLEQFPGAIKIGSTTAAADGNVARIILPGEIETYATFLGTFYPDYSPTQRIGIIPDIEISPTIEGIRAGRDELMEMAFAQVDCGAVNVEEEWFTQAIELFPNPAQSVIRYQLPFAVRQLEVELRVIDALGRVIHQQAVDSNSGQVNCANWADGIYTMQFTNGVEQVVEKVLKTE
ncbi:MAG: T9SS type A sorting domain-containing protein [Saprospiraceae bacterium]